MFRGFCCGPNVSLSVFVCACMHACMCVCALWESRIQLPKKENVNWKNKSLGNFMGYYLILIFLSGALSNINISQSMVVLPHGISPDYFISSIFNIRVNIVFL